jgi:glutathione peroxidase
MNRIYLIISGLLLISAQVFSFCGAGSNDTTGSIAGIYEFKVKDIDGKDVSLSEFKGKVLLIVNVASKCGYTSQYKGLQELYEKYKDQGFVILAFPCNQFRGQEPGTNAEIKEFCSTTYNVTFSLMDKVDVNGPKAIPLYNYLTRIFGEQIPIKWNFTKFLVGRDGIPVGRFETKTEPEQMSLEVEEALEPGKLLKSK